MTNRAGLLDALRRVAAGLPNAPEGRDGDVVSWSRGSLRFAVVRGAVAELRIGAAIGAAALRTPDTSTSTLGPDWIAFAPAELDSHSLDRLTAWFGAAYRRAEARS